MSSRVHNPSRNGTSGARRTPGQLGILGPAIYLVRRSASLRRLRAGSVSSAARSASVAVRTASRMPARWRSWLSDETLKVPAADAEEYTLSDGFYARACMLP
jgi:hypothetical protein